MAKPTWQERVAHMLDAIVAIEGYTSRMTLKEYEANRLVADAVERNLERISEASRHIPEDVRQRFADIPWRQIADIGNVLRHGYDGVSDTRVFQTVTADLPPLKAAMERILGQNDGSV